MCGVFDGLDWVGIVEKWWKLWRLVEEVVLIWDGSLFFMLYLRGNDRRIEWKGIGVKKN